MAIDSRITGTLGGAGQGAATGAMVGGIPGAIAGGILGGIGGILSSGGEDDAQKMAEEQAKLVELQAREDQRRKMAMAQQQVGLAKATTLASNIMDSGSSKKYRNYMESEYRRELAYDRYVTKKQAEMIRQGGESAVDSISRGGLSSMISGIGSLGTAYAGGAFGSTKPKGLFGEGSTSNIYSGNF